MSSIRRLERVLNELGPARRSSRRRLRVSKGRRSLREAIGDIPDYIIDGSFVVPDGVTEIRDYAFDK